MVNKRFVKRLADFKGNQLASVMKRISKVRPEGTEVPVAARIPDSDKLADRDIPFMAGDRVQIASGPDRGKVGQIVARYPMMGNAFYVAGVGVQKIVNPIQGKIAAGEQYDPVVDNFKVFDFKDLRLVSKVRFENGTEEDVVIHSLKLGAEEYDARSNTYPRVRYAEHDSSITIPFPLEAAKAVDSPMTTAAPTVDLRTHYVTSSITCPLPIGSIDQITNLNARFKRSRYAPALSATQVARAQPPSMPIPPKTRKLLQELAAMPKPPKVEFTQEIEDFLGSEIKTGLQKRLEKEAEARKTYL